MTNRRSELMARYNRLRPVLRAVMQLCSVIYEASTANRIFRCIKKWPGAPTELSTLTNSQLLRLLRRLQQLELLGSDFRCDDSIVEIMTRQAADRGWLESMAKAVEESGPPYGYFARTREDLFLQSFNAFRLNLYRRDFEVAQLRYNELTRYQDVDRLAMDPLLMICNNPFDPRWFGSLPLSLQASVLTRIFYETIYFLSSDLEALDYVLAGNFLDSLDRREHAALYHLLSLRLMMAGRMSEARELYSFPPQRPFSDGLQPSIDFLLGNCESAVASFEAELAVIRGLPRGNNDYFLGMSGIFFLLALLQLEDGAGLDRAESICELKRTARTVDPPLLSAYQSLKAIVRVLRYDIDGARLILDSDKESRQSSVATVFHAMARYWLDRALPQPVIDSLSRLFISARNVHLDWLALEIAELLCRVEQETPLRRKYIKRVNKASGLRSFVSTITIEEPWRRVLRALTYCVRQSEEQKAVADSRRLVWLLEYEDGLVTLHPREQTLGASGTWSKGRPVAMKRLYEGSKMDYLTPQDQNLRATLEKTGLYGSAEYDLDMDRALSALIGHPLVFLEEAPTVPVEIVRGELEVSVTLNGSRINIALTRDLPLGRVVMVRETPTRFKVIELGDEQRRIIRYLSDAGVSAPATAKDEVLETVSALSSVVTVHSSVGGVGEEVQGVEADSTPHVHLMPAGTGFSLELFVRPFGEDGPYLKPGAGAATVIAEIGGVRQQAWRDLVEESSKAMAAAAACPLLLDLQEDELRWLVNEPEDCLQILVDLKTLQDRSEVVVFWPEGEKLKVSREISFDRLHLNVQSKSDWFEMSGELRVDDDLVVDMKRLLELAATSRGRFIPLGDGQFLALTEQLRKRLKELESFSQRRGKSFYLHPLAALAMENLAEAIPHFTADTAWKSRLQEIHSGLAFTPTIPSILKAELRDYQAAGYAWLVRLSRLGLGACLADDMGLGKTIQALALLLDRASLGPALVVAPTSVCMNWIEESARFAPSLRTVAFGGNDRERVVRELGAGDLLVCSYGLLVQEADRLGSVQWSSIVLDEAQAIKNAGTKRAKAAMGLKGAFRMVTTGTPIENHLGEFWSLFHFINPGLLGSLKKFNERFAVPIEKYQDMEVRRRLKKLIQPFILRRTKSQVLDELPPRTEVTLQVEMAQKETAFYEALRQQALERLAQDNGPFQQKHVKILAEIMKLRQAACNPRLIAADSAIPSAKLEVFLEVVSELLESRHKALVFSQFVGHLNLIREALDRRRIDYRYIDGSTPTKIRKQEVDAFQSGHGDLFLISLKAGGLGLNLTAADYVIHMDPWWNPAVEDQASDRAHRIGQQRPVTVYRLVVRNTIEEKIVKLHAEKRDLAGSLLAGSDVSGKISAEELLQLIRGEG